MKNKSAISFVLMAAIALVAPLPVQGQSTEPVDILPTAPTSPSLTSRTNAIVSLDAQLGDLASADVLAGEDALSEVSIDVNPTDANNQVIVGHDANLVTMNTFYTTDGGLTWTPVILGDAQDGLSSTFRFDPAVAFDDDGNVYVGYGARTPRPGGGNQRTVVVCRSTDGGASYPNCTTIDTAADIASLPGNDKWMLATGPDPITPTQQNVYIAWTRNVTEASGTDQRIVVSRSTDGGTTFSAPLTINDGSISGTSSGNLFADPAVGPNGELYVAWHDIGGGQVWLDVSLDGGLTFSTDIVVTASSAGFKQLIPAQPDRGVGIMPTIDTDRSGGAYDGRLYLAYSDIGAGGGADFNVLVRSSDDGGVTWTAPTIVHDDSGTNSQFLPWLDVDQQTGHVVTVWYDARNDADNKQVEVFLAASYDGGATWASNVLVSDKPSDMSVDNVNRYLGNFLEYIGVASLGDMAFPVWADNSENGDDLDYYTDQISISLDSMPVCDADGPYTAECGVPESLDGSASNDPDGGALTYDWSGPFLGSPLLDGGAKPSVVFTSPTGSKSVGLTVTDDEGNGVACSSDVTVVDTTVSVIDCGAPATITPIDAPISFTATADDVCEGPLAPVVIDYSCYKLTKKGKVIDKWPSCVVSFAGDTVTVADSGGVGTRIEWTAQAVDGSGNISTAYCGVDVVKP